MNIIIYAKGSSPSNSFYDITKGSRLLQNRRPRPTDSPVTPALCSGRVYSDSPVTPALCSGRVYSDIITICALRLEYY